MLNVLLMEKFHKTVQVCSGEIKPRPTCNQLNAGLAGEARGEARGEAKGLAKGLAQGKAEGLTQGKAEGLAQGKAELTLMLLSSNIPDCPVSFCEQVKSSTDIAWLDRVFRLALCCSSWEELKAKGM